MSDINWKAVCVTILEGAIVKSGIDYVKDHYLINATDGYNIVKNTTIDIALPKAVGGFKNKRSKIRLRRNYN